MALAKELEEFRVANRSEELGVEKTRADKAEARNAELEKKDQKATRLWRILRQRRVAF